MIEVRQPLQSELERAFYLRWQVLRRPLGLPRGSEQDEYDSREETIHGAAFEGGFLVSTGRINRRNENPSELQIRYMATELEYRGRGIGREVLNLMEELATPLAAKAIILKARVNVKRFYEGAGYEVCSDEFLAPEIGLPHVSMRKEING